MGTSTLATPVETVNTNSELLLKVDGASFRYSPRTPWLFKDLSMSLRAGEVLSVLGPNARGKTTLLKNLAGLLHPSQGVIDAKATIGYVPQDHGANASFLVKDMVLMGRTR